MGARHQALMLKRNHGSLPSIIQDTSFRGLLDGECCGHGRAARRGAPVVDGGEVARVKRAAEERADDVRAVAVAVAVVGECAVQPDLAVRLAGERWRAGGRVHARRRRPVHRRVAEEAVVAVCRPTRVMIRVRIDMIRVMIRLRIGLPLRSPSDHAPPWGALSARPPRCSGPAQLRRLSASLARSCPPRTADGGGSGAGRCQTGLAASPAHGTGARARRPAPWGARTDARVARADDVAAPRQPGRPQRVRALVLRQRHGRLGRRARALAHGRRLPVVDRARRTRRQPVHLWPLREPGQHLLRRRELAQRLPRHAPRTLRSANAPLRTAGTTVTHCSPQLSTSCGTCARPTPFQMLPCRWQGWL